MSVKNLQKAKANKSDEFYTQLTDIEKELKHYKHHLKDKIVYCNCDDPRASNFFHYFSYNFEKLGLKRLITTGYKNQEIDLFSENNSERAICLIYEGPKKSGGVPALDDVHISYLKGDGDFRSEESIELLKQADVLITNPPFSLWGAFVEVLTEHKKDFLIIGNMNAITYKECFKLIKEGKLWLGASIHSGDREFGVPDDYPITGAGWRIDEKGNKFIRVKGVRWFTNMDYDRRHEDLILYKKYTPEEYPQYENYNAINVDKAKDIPMDYDGEMGVPITFMDKFNPEQFEIIALGITGSCEFTSNRKMEILDKNGKRTGKFTRNAKGTLYKKYNPKKDKRPAFIDCETGELYASIYARIIIRNKKVGATK